MNKRTLKEIENAVKSPLYTFVVEEKNDTQRYLINFVVKDGIYIGQKHTLEIHFVYDEGRKIYPTNPPLVRFLTHILHPNISVNGGICVDVLSSKWSPLMGIDAVFNLILLLLDEPNPSSPLNNEASKVLNLPLEERKCVIQKYYEENNKSKPST